MNGTLCCGRSVSGVLRFMRRGAVAEVAGINKEDFEWRGVEEYGGVWKSMEGCGGVWRGVEGCGEV